MFALANRNNTFVTVELKSGPVTIIAGSCGGPYSDSEMTDALSDKIRRGIVSKIDIEERKPQVKTKKRPAEKEENQNIEITEDDNEC